MKLNNVLYDGPRLLVPVQLEVMMVDYFLRNRENRRWARVEAEYNNLVKHKGAAFPRSNATKGSISMPAGGKDKDKGVPDLGVHIHWNLPMGLRHGNQEENSEEVLFPNVPNRWAMVRLWVATDGQLEMKFWVIQSDLIQEPQDHKEGTNYLMRDSVEDKLLWKKIGKVALIEHDKEWPIKNNSDYRLKAIGVEDTTFSAYSINNQEVFTAVDSLEDLEAIIADTDNTIDHFDLSYFLIGWYSDPKEDPLYQNPDGFDPAKLLETMTDLEWNIGGKVGLNAAQEAFKKWIDKKNTTLAPLTLCFGGIHSIHWYGQKNTSSRSNSSSGKPHFDRDDPPGIIIANSSMDALIRFITHKLEKSKGNTGSPDLSEKQLKLAADLIYAFEKGVLEDFVNPGGPGLLEREIKKNWFDAELGGTEWAIIQNKKPYTQKEEQRLKEIFKNALPTLGFVNAAQQEINYLVDLKESKLLEWFTCLYNSKTVIDYKSEWAALVKKVEQQLKKIDTDLKGAHSILDTERTKLIQLLGIKERKEVNDFSIKERLLPPYWTPSSPVLLVHAAKTSYNVNLQNNLDCRYTGQTIDSLTIHGTEEVIKLDEAQFNIPQLEHFPKEIASLLSEFILLNPNFAPWLKKEKASLIEIQQTMIWNPEKYEGFDAQLLTQQAGFTGVRPSFVGFQTYTNPWSPLFLDWMVYFFQKGGRQTVSKTKAKDWFNNWTLTENSMDFDWDLNVEPPKVDTNIDTPYFWKEEGRSLLSSHMPQILKDRLAALDQNQLNVAQKSVINAVISILEGFDIITQRMNGLNDLWLQYDSSNPIPIELLLTKSEKEKKKDLLNKRFGIPRGRPIVENKKVLNRFFPLRSGYILPHFVRITSNFGIGLYPDGIYNPREQWNSSDKKVIPKGRGMNNPAIADSRLAQLPPRLLQAARIRMEWIDGNMKKDPIVVSQADQNSPLAGWIIPNHLDKSLMIFDKDGILQGSLMFFERDKTFWVRKELDPVSGGTDKFKIDNFFLRTFVNKLLSFNGDEGDTLSAFLQNIDVTSWVTDPMGPREKKGMSALIGRPLALVRSRVSMELKGTAIRYLNEEEPKEYQPEQPANPFGLMDVDFPFYVGEDQLPNNGLVGYFDRDDFATFWVIADHASKPVAFIKERDTLKTRLNDSSMAEEDKNFRYLSMLVDYRGLIHTVSGLLPVIQLGLSKEMVESALANMEVTFRTGPLIADPNQLRMPKPNDIRGKLSWIYQSGIKIWKEDQKINPDQDAWENQNIQEATETASFPNKKRNQLMEGWLKLSDALTIDPKTRKHE